MIPGSSNRCFGVALASEEPLPQRRGSPIIMKAIEDWNAADERPRELLKGCKRAVEEVAPGVEVILFGSRARGEPAVHSDYDLLVLTQGDPTATLKQSIRDRLYDAALHYEVVISVMIYSHRRWNDSPWRASPLHEEVERDGVLL